MSVEEENQTESPTEDQEKTVQAENVRSELRERVWSVVSFEKQEATGLTYTEAEQKLSELEEQKVSGLCIVTDDVAARITPQQ